jgi:hypothetical protein
MKKKWCSVAFLGCLLGILFCFAQNTQGANGDSESASPPPEKPPQLTLVKAVMCEGLEELEPVNQSIIFSVSHGSVFCFTAFDPVPEKTVIYHHWIKRDQPEKEIKLTLKTPRWSSFSKISIRSMDVGPWRVEILDSDSKILKTLRFSVTE